jgi:putative ABC transport system permease protein
MVSMLLFSDTPMGVFQIAIPLIIGKQGRYLGNFGAAILVYPCVAPGRAPMREIIEDLRFACRLLAKYPGFAVTAVLTLGLGIALNTCAFGVVNALWFRPLEVRDDARVAVVSTVNPKKGLWQHASLPDYADWSAGSSAFERTAAFVERSYNLSGTGADASEPERVSGGDISSSTLEMLGIFPMLGRPFLAGEYQGGGDAGGVRPILISERLWRRRFAAEPGIAGRQVRVDGRPAVIVGVLPYRFRFIYGGYHVIAPLDERALVRAERGARFAQVLARLKPGITLERAQTEMSAISAHLAGQYPKTNQGWETRVTTYRQFVFATALRMYPILLAGALLLLLIVCANVSSLVLARAIARRRELAVRVALGASRSRLVKQMLAEGMLVAVVGGALALVVAAWGRALLVAGYPEMATLALDYRVFAYTLLMAGLAGLAFGLAPALTASRPDLNETLKATGRSAAGGSAHRLRSVLVVAEMSLALVLLAGTGLLIESARRLGNTEAGFNTSHLLTARLSLPESGYAAPERQAEFTRALVQRLSVLPGVRAVALTSALPLMGQDAPRQIEVAGRSARPEGDYLQVSLKSVTPEYFEALGVAVRAGRPLASGDRAGAPETAVVNVAFARTLGGTNQPPAAAVGQRIRVGGGPWRTIVGVADDVRQRLDRPASPEILVSQYQEPVASLGVLLRTSSNPEELTASVRRELRTLDRDLPVSDIQTMEEIVRDYYPRVMAVGLGLFATVAMALAALGLYGVISYLVTQRTQEIGIRIILGAGRSSVLRLVLGQAFRLAALGVTIGLAGAFALARVLSQFLYGVSGSDPAVFAVVSAGLFAVALVAAWLPARRAARVDPAVALRYE